MALRNMTIQLIKHQDRKFLLQIGEKRYWLYKVNLFPEEDFEFIKPKVKGATIGFYLQGGFVSFRKIEKAIRK